jgi:membrane-associated PAP2 superfamily phosphatase
VTASGPGRFAAANLIGLALTGISLVWLSRSGTLDFKLAGAFFDPALRRFPLSDAPLLAEAGHTGLRWLAVSIWSSAVVFAASSWKVAALHSLRAPLLFFSATVAVATLTISLLRAASAHSCPWDMSVFGGSAIWFPLFDAPGVSPGPGRCWPSGHAAGGFALLAGYFALRDGHRGPARLALSLALGLGTLMSLTQMARGAHFLTHNLWSLWLAWLTCFASYLFWRHSCPGE